VLQRILVRWAIIGIAFAITVNLLSNIHVVGGFWGYVWVAALFGLVNAFIGTILKILTFPLTVLTLGISALLVNAALLGITASLSKRLTIHGFWTAIWAALIISIVSAILNRVLIDRRLRDRDHS
jgi:putative membrane protein